MHRRLGSGEPYESEHLIVFLICPYKNDMYPNGMDAIKKECLVISYIVSIRFKESKTTFNIFKRDDCQESGKLCSIVLSNYERLTGRCFS